MKRAMDMNSGDGCTMLWMYSYHWTVYLKWVRELILCYVYFTTIKRIKKKIKIIKNKIN